MAGIGPQLNVFQVKRQAHAISRSDAGWNPFRKVWNTGHHRSQTWNGNDAEAQGGSTPNDLERSKSEEIRPVVHDDLNPERHYSTGETTAVGPERPVHRLSTSTRKRNSDPDLNGTAEESRPGKKKVLPQEPFTVANQIQRTLFASWINVLLLCVPAGIVLGPVVGPSLPTFFVNYAAVIPLYWLGDIAMTEIGVRTGELLANYIAISTSNLVQLISCILLLVNGKITILKTTLIGGILANILLLLGMGMFFGGLRRPEQYFNRTSSHTSSVLLSLASTSLLIPTASLLMSQTTTPSVTKQSRGASVILVIVYVLYIYFSLHTHREVFQEHAQKVPMRPWKSLDDGTILVEWGEPSGAHGKIQRSGRNNFKLQQMLNADTMDEDDNYDEYQEPRLSLAVALATFLVTTVLIYFCVDYVVNSIDSLTSASGLSDTFIGVVLLPFLNCDFTLVDSATQDNMNAVMDYTVGKSIQTALMVTPLNVLLAWWLGIEGVTLVFDGFEVVSLFATILLLNLIISEAKSSWVMGVLLLADWALVAIAAFFVESMDDVTVPER